MPYDSTNELPEQTKNLTSKEKRAFKHAFNSAKESGKSEKSAFKIAWHAAKGAGERSPSETVDKHLMGRHEQKDHAPKEGGKKRDSPHSRSQHEQRFETGAAGLQEWAEPLGIGAGFGAIGIGLSTPRGARWASNMFTPSEIQAASAAGSRVHGATGNAQRVVRDAAAATSRATGRARDAVKYNRRFVDVFQRGAGPKTINTRAVTNVRSRAGALTAVAGLAKHLRGQHDQDDHDPTMGQKIKERGEGLAEAGQDAVRDLRRMGTEGAMDRISEGIQGFRDKSTGAEQAEIAAYAAISGASAHIGRKYLPRSPTTAAAYGAYSLAMGALTGTKISDVLGRDGSVGKSETGDIDEMIETLSEMAGVEPEEFIEDFGEWLGGPPHEVNADGIRQFMVDVYGGGLPEDEVDDAPSEGTYAEGMADALKIVGDISKVDDEHRQVFGWASITEINGEPVVDLQNDYMETYELEKAAYDYVLNSRVGGEMHQRVGKSKPKQVATLIESFVLTPEKIEKMGLPESTPKGWWIGFQIPKDKSGDEVWKAVKSNKYAGFSIHGMGKRMKKSLEFGKQLTDRSPEEFKGWLKRMSKQAGVPPEQIKADLIGWMQQNGVPKPSDDDIHEFLIEAYGQGKGAAVEKHLLGNHDQKDHDPTKGDKEGHSRDEHNTLGNTLRGGAAGAVGGAAGLAGVGALTGSRASVIAGLARQGAKLGIPLGAIIGASMGASESGMDAEQRRRKKGKGKYDDFDPETATSPWDFPDANTPEGKAWYDERDGHQIGGDPDQIGRAEDRAKRAKDLAHDSNVRLLGDLENAMDRAEQSERTRGKPSSSGLVTTGNAKMDRQLAEEAERIGANPIKYVAEAAEMMNQAQKNRNVRKALIAKAAEYADSVEEFEENLEYLNKHLIGNHNQGDHDPTKKGGGHSRKDHSKVEDKAGVQGDPTLGAKAGAGIMGGLGALRSAPLGPIGMAVGGAAGALGGSAMGYQMGGGQIFGNPGGSQAGGVAAGLGNVAVDPLGTAFRRMTFGDPNKSIQKNVIHKAMNPPKKRALSDREREVLAKYLGR